MPLSSASPDHCPTSCGISGRRGLPPQDVVAWPGGREETTSAVGASPGGSGGPALRGSGSLALLEQDAQLAFEVRELLEVLVHAGEPKVRHIVQAAQQGQ